MHWEKTDKWRSMDNWSRCISCLQGIHYILLLLLFLSTAALHRRAATNDAAEDPVKSSWISTLCVFLMPESRLNTKHIWALDARGVLGWLFLAHVCMYVYMASILSTYIYNTGCYWLAQIDYWFYHVFLALNNTLSTLGVVASAWSSNEESRIMNRIFYSAAPLA